MGNRALTVAALALAAGTSVAAGAVSLISSSATIVHTSNLGTTPASRTTGAFTPANFASPNTATPPLTLPLGLLGNATTNTTAKAGIGTVTGSSFIGFALATGTSLTQKGNLNPSPDTASSLSITFSASWMVVGTFGMGAQAGASLSMSGTLPLNPPPGPNTPSPTAFFRTSVDATFTATAGAAPFAFRPTITSTNFLYTNFQGPFSLTNSDLIATFPSEFSNGTILTLAGTITYFLHNENDEAMAEIRQQTPGGNFSGAYEPVIPAPGAGALLGLGGLLAARRRR